MAQITQQGAPLNLAGVAGSPFSVTLNITATDANNNPIPWTAFTNPAVVMTANVGAQDPANLPTITSPQSGQYVVSWTAAQTAAMASGQWALEATINGVGPEVLCAGALQMGSATAPAASTSTTASLAVSVGASTVNLSVSLGGATANAPRVRSFPFAYNSPGLSVPSAGSIPGFSVFTPTVGDLLLDAWVEVDTAWNGTTPKGDFGQFKGNPGWFENAWGGAFDMTAADQSGLLSNQLLSGGSSAAGFNTISLDTLSELLEIGGAQFSIQSKTSTNMAFMAGAGAPPANYAGPPALYLNTATSTWYEAKGDGTAWVASGGLQLNPIVNNRYLPAKFLTADPVKIVVSTNGFQSGSNPGATQGSGVLYLVTATPG